MRPCPASKRLRVRLSAGPPRRRSSKAEHALGTGAGGVQFPSAAPVLASTARRSGAGLPNLEVRVQFPLLALRGRGPGVRHHLAKVDLAGSIPAGRSMSRFTGVVRRLQSGGRGFDFPPDSPLRLLVDGQPRGLYPRRAGSSPARRSTSCSSRWPRMRPSQGRDTSPTLVQDATPPQHDGSCSALRTRRLKVQVLLGAPFSPSSRNAGAALRRQTAASSTLAGEAAAVVGCLSQEGTVPA